VYGVTLILIIKFNKSSNKNTQRGVKEVGLPEVLNDKSNEQILSIY
jgi:hypothetical protein